MGLWKSIQHRKEKRKPYYGSRRFDLSCCNHGSCPWCYSNRMYQQRKLDVTAKQELMEFANGCP